jgi:hypothetical protein
MTNPKPEIQLIRGKTFRSTIVRESLRHHRSACAGFALGRILPAGETPFFEFALVAMIFQDYFGANTRKLENLSNFKSAAELTASASGRAVIGLWAAWDTPWPKMFNKAERDAALVSQAVLLNIPFVITLATDGGEPMWPLHFWACADYPHPPLYGSKYKGIPVEGPQDNPRRVKAEWRKQLILRGLPIP